MTERVVPCVRGSPRGKSRPGLGGGLAACSRSGASSPSRNFAAVIGLQKVGWPAAGGHYGRRTVPATILAWENGGVWEMGMESGGQRLASAFAATPTTGFNYSCWCVSLDGRVNFHKSVRTPQTAPGRRWRTGRAGRLCLYAPTPVIRATALT